MQGRGLVMAFDRDKIRLKRLVANAQVTGASIISAEAKDFMTLDPKSAKFAKVAQPFYNLRHLLHVALVVCACVYALDRGGGGPANIHFSPKNLEYYQKKKYDSC